MTRTTLGACTVAVILSVFTPNILAADTYRLGVEAFKQGRYEAARHYFTEAHATGRHDATLFYNLGSSEFKLGDYPAAHRSFAQIAYDPQWGSLAQFNLGLIEDKLGNPDAAQRHYRVAFETAQSDKLKQLSALKLDEAPPSQTDDGAWFGVVSVGGGYDDNVVLLNDQSLIGVSNEADYFGEALASASGFVRGDVDGGWRVDAVGYYRGYRDLTEFDYGTATLGLTYNAMSTTAQWQAGARANAQFVGGDAYTTSGTLRMQMLRSLGRFSVRVRNDTTRIEGADNFGYLTGWQNRLGVQFDRRFGTYRARAGYELELNDRNDAQTPTEFFSYSPTWNRFYADGTKTVSDEIEVQLRAEYQFSRYADENIETLPNGSTSTAARSDDRLTASIRLTYRLSDAWNTFGEYAYSNNSSKFSQYEYTDNQFMIGIERPF